MQLMNLQMNTERKGRVKEMNKEEYTIAELFEEAKNDSTWEEDPQKREQLCMIFKRALSQLS